MTEASPQAQVGYDPRLFEDAKDYCLRNPLYTVSGLLDHLKQNPNSSAYRWAPSYADAYAAISYLMDVQAIPRRDRVGT